ncbi:MAG: DUF6503 family protein [Allomuricauda sp.]
MRKLISILLVFFVAACKQNPKKENAEATVETKVVVTPKKYPEALQSVFDAHGGLKNWKAQRTLAYELPKPDSKEVHTIDLWSRKDRVDTEKFSMGSSDGTKVWLLDADENYKGDAVFYHNLMFYFYAMPFVLADEGIHYGKTEDLEYEGKSYPGVSVSYESGVGASPKDEYYIHFDPETNKMAWLGYTVTYRTGESSDNVKWIRYDDWQQVGDVTLPKSITWYNYEGTKILDARSPVQFENVSLSKMGKPDSFFAKPESAVWIEPKTH